MSTCVNCYNSSTAAPCASVGCISTNYAKCITYSGSDLYCQTGSIATFIFTGVAVSPSVDTTTLVTVTGGSGSGATFNVTRKAGYTTYTVTLVSQGTGYTVGNVLTILGTSLGGTSANNILVTVASLAPIIYNGENLDEVILNLNQRLCLASTSGLDYSAFNYSCLRVGGILTGVGTVITTAQQFTESTSSALCALNTRVLAVEKPAITVPSCFSSTLTSGTSTLVNILDLYGANICTLNTNTNLAAVTSSPCVGYAFTTRPANNIVLADYINWITTNMCGMFTTNNNLILAQTAKVNALYTYITGSTSGTVPASIDTSCLSGGSLTSNLKDAVVLIKNNLCSLNSTVAALGGATNLTVNWSCFTSPYTPNSVFNAQALGTFTSTTSLQTHLNQIASALSALNIKFDSTYFTVSNSSCGPIVSLASSSSFSCSSLSTCSINALADVDTTGVATGDTLKWNGTNFVPSSSTPTSANLVSAIAPSSWALPLSWSNASLGGTLITVYPEVSKLNRLVVLGQSSLVKIATSSIYPTISAGTQITLFTIPSGYTPLSTTGNQYVSGTIMKVDGTSGLIVATYPVMFTILSTGTILMTFLSAPTAPASTDYFILPMGGISWFS